MYHGDRVPVQLVPSGQWPRQHDRVEQGRGPPVGIGVGHVQVGRVHAMPGDGRDESRVVTDLQVLAERLPLEVR